ncbi:hypothetical protein BB559_005760 [Furculomyces boomerangus]|uniref:Uncharacterized protein n=2 Tax=Harpellales TaxID=61421 RepID=A0A2T9Y6U5_9FUNG|nr:hypothetical protein BB559_005760 [Furculomyces boomerangus]PVZ97691.1 hypothetical protein BB558_006342 [Smittium angustum]
MQNLFVGNLSKKSLKRLSFLNLPKTIQHSRFYSSNPDTIYSRLNKKTVFITGATSGIGKACAWNFANAGANLIVTGRRFERLEELSSQIKEKNPSVEIHCSKLDVRDKQNIDAVVKGLPKDLAEVDILVNNAGLVVGLEPLEIISSEDIDTMMDTNVKGLVYCTQALLPSLKLTNGHIVNIGSIAGIEAYQNGSIYCASKHAVRAITQSLRHELMSTGVKITEVDPGMVETEFSVVRFRGDEGKAKNVYKGIKPLSAQDIAEIVVFATSRASHVEIANLTVFPHGQASATQSFRKGL